MSDFLVSNFRDNDSLPLTGNITRKTGIYFGALIYAIAVVFFAIVFWAYTAFDSLKTTNTYISTTGEPNCIILSQVRATYTYTSSGQLGPALTKLRQAVPGWEFWGYDFPRQISYSGVYFSSFDECIETMGGKSVVFSYNYSQIPINKGATSHTVFSVIPPVSGIEFTGGGDYSIAANWFVFPRTSEGDIYALIQKEVKATLTPTALCDPFRDLPPYQCEELIQLSPLSILSQTLSLTMTVIGVLFTLSSALFGLMGVNKVASLNSYLKDGK